MVDPISAGAGIISGLFGLFGGKKKNKNARQEFELQKKLADKQIEYGDYIQELSKTLQQQKAGFKDAYGGGAVLNPATGEYESKLGAVPQQLQNASDAEELARNTIDQQLRRTAMQDVERRRVGAATDADTSRADLANARLGIGQVDPDRIGSQMRLDRTGAINAGYDDAMRAASTIGLRTGSSSTATALGELARQRANARMSMGSPEIEGLQLAEGINQGRTDSRMNLYNMFSSQADKVPEVNFNPAPYAAEAAARTQDAQKIDLSKFEIGMGGSGTAAASVGNAAAGIRQAYNDKEKNYEYNLGGKFVDGLNSLFKPGG